MGVCTSKFSASQSRIGHPTLEFDSSTSMSKTSKEDLSSDQNNNISIKSEGERGKIIDEKLEEQTKEQDEKLGDSQRRRLSVSTVQVNDDVAQFSSELKEVEPKKNVDSDHIDNTAAAIVNHSVSFRLKKYPDPALELLDEKTGTIRDVTVDMILDLVNSSNSSYMVFGAPSEDVQKGFDNKRTEIVGSLSPSWDPMSNGIGYICKKGLKPESPNQDDFFIIKIDDWSLYGVFDGHGPFGHNVSDFIHRVLPFLLLSDPNFEADPMLVMRRAFRKAHHLLEALSESGSSSFDCSLSGTTGTVILHRDNRLVVAHVGDSRSVLASRSKNHFKATDLTQDHKPTLDDEKRRIEAHGGDVRRLEGDIPYRVFMRNRMYPGLAMSRAIGDTVGSAVGIVPDPDIKVVDLDPTAVDQFVIVSTDGVWEFISSQESVDFICQKKKSDVQKAVEFVAYESWRRWVEEEESVVDDVTCIVFWLNND